MKILLKQVKQAKKTDLPYLYYLFQLFSVKYWWTFVRKDSMPQATTTTTRRTPAVVSVTCEVLAHMSNKWTFKHGQESVNMSCAEWVTPLVPWSPGGCGTVEIGGANAVESIPLGHQK